MNGNSIRSNGNCPAVKSDSNSYLWLISLKFSCPGLRLRTLPHLNIELKSRCKIIYDLFPLSVSDFTDTLAQLYEQHAEALQVLVSTYRKKNGELRKERPTCQSGLFHAWETFLQEIEADSQSSSDVANALSRQVRKQTNRNECNVVVIMFNHYYYCLSSPSFCTGFTSIIRTIFSSESSE